MDSKVRVAATWVAALTMGAIVAGSSSTTLAQSGRYSSDWRNPDQTQSQQRSDDRVVTQRGEAQVQDMVDELSDLIEAAAAARAADPTFLRDLRGLARRYDWPWRKRVLFDDFSDGNVSSNPSWTVGGAPVSVDRTAGLRTRVTRTAQTTSQSQEPVNPEDFAVQILGQILQQGSGARQQQSSQADEMVMAISARTANQFALESDIVFANADGGNIELGVIQGTDGLGYRVSIKPDGRNADVEILRVGARGSAVVEALRVPGDVWLAKSASQPKKVLFTRDRRGRMQLSFDGNVVLTTRDRAFSDGFDGFIVRNRGGDFTIQNIAGYSS